MALGVNMQWGYAGLFNVGVMGFVALGGLAAVLVSMPPVGRGLGRGRLQRHLGLVLGAATIVGAILVWTRMAAGTAADAGDAGDPDRRLLRLPRGLRRGRRGGRGGRPGLHRAISAGWACR
jgi:hypothetical protein